MVDSLTEKICPLCRQKPGTINDDFKTDARHIICNCCGTFRVTTEAFPYLDLRDDTHRLSGLAREHRERYGKPLEIIKPRLEEYYSQAPSEFDVVGKARRLLFAVKRRSKFAGYVVELQAENDYPLAYARNAEEFVFLCEYLRDLTWATVDIPPLRLEGRTKAFITLTPQGWEETRKLVGAESPKAFVAMWFHESMDETYRKAIGPALEECGYKPRRINDEDYLGGVVDEIIAEIRESRFIVADVTGQRNGVYFEGGFAMGLGLPVVWTCHKDEVEEKKLHFDTQHLNHIVWDSPENLKRQLANRVRAVIGIGPLKS